MPEPLIATLILVTLFALWFWGRTPIIFRNVRPGGLLEHCDGLIRSGDGTRLFIRDEATDHEVELDKMFASRNSIEVTVLIMNADTDSLKKLTSLTKGPHLNRAIHSPFEGKFALIYRINRDEKSAITQLFEILSKILDGLNSSVDRTYELYYKNRAFGAEVRRSKYEEQLRSTDSTDRQRKHAQSIIDALDKRIEKSIAKKNDELDKRLRER